MSRSRRTAAVVFPFDHLVGGIDVDYVKRRAPPGGHKTRQRQQGVPLHYTNVLSFTRLGHIRTESALLLTIETKESASGERVRCSHDNIHSCSFV